MACSMEFYGGGLSVSLRQAPGTQLGAWGRWRAASAFGPKPTQRGCTHSLALTARIHYDGQQRRLYAYVCVCVSPILL